MKGLGKGHVEGTAVASGVSQWGGQGPEQGAHTGVPESPPSWGGSWPPECREWGREGVCEELGTIPSQRPRCPQPLRSNIRVQMEILGQKA